MRSALLILFVVVAGLGVPSLQAQSSSSPALIFTVAGGTFGDGRLATSTGIGAVSVLAIDKSGSVYFASQDNFVILKIDSTGTLRTVAGNGVPASGFNYEAGAFPPLTTSGNGDGGPATDAELGYLVEIQFDGSGNLYILEADINYYGARIRKVDPSGTISTLAGSGTCGNSGDGGPASKATICLYDMRVDQAGNVYFLDSSTSSCCSRIRKIDSSGVISTVAGNGTAGESGDGGQAIAAEISAIGITLDQGDNLFFVNSAGPDVRIRKVGANGIISTYAGNGTLGSTGDGGPATAAEIYPPGLRNLLLDDTGNLYFVDGASSARIRRVDTAGIITTYTGTGVSGFSGDGGKATNAEISAYELFLDANGNLFFVNSPPQSPQSPRVRKVDGTGVITTIIGNGTVGYSGDGGPATAAEILFPQFFANGTSGTLYFLDQPPGAFNAYVIRDVDANGIITTVGGNGTAGLSGMNGPATSSQIDGPAGIALDSGGNLYFADYEDSFLRKVDTSGNITTIAGNGQCCSALVGQPAINSPLNDPIGIAVDNMGDVLFTEPNSCAIYKIDTGGLLSILAGNNTCGFSGDGGPATSAAMSDPLAVITDSIGGTYFGDTTNYRVRKIDTSGIITTVAGNGTSGFSGDGSAATSAQIAQPAGLAVDNLGNLFIADPNNFRVRKVDTKGIITTYAGDGTQGYTGDNGAAIDAEFGDINGLAVDSSGNLYIADGQNNRVRMVNTNGVITTVVGSGTLGYSGDGGPATSASLSFPGALAISSTGALYIGDVFNYRIRKVVAALSVSTAGLPGGTIGMAYNQTLQAVGTAPYTWSVTSGTLPLGLSLSAAGAISGTPTTAGTSSFTVSVKDANVLTATQALSIVVVPPLTVTTTSLPGGTIGTTYSQTVQATGGIPPYTWSIASGNLPPGLSLNAAGAIAGTPTTAGTFTLTVSVADANGIMSASGLLSLVVAAPPNAPTCMPPTVQSDSTKPNPLSVIATSNCTDAQSAITSTTIDWGDGSPPLSGTTGSHTYVAGTYSITVSATNANNLTNSASGSVTVTAPLTTTVTQGQATQQTANVTAPLGVPSVQVTYQCSSATGPSGTQTLAFYHLSCNINGQGTTAMVTLTSTPTPITVAVQTNSSSTAGVMQPGLRRGSAGALYAAVLMAPGILLVGIGRFSKRRRRLSQFIGMALLGMLMGSLLACGGGGGSSQSPPPPQQTITPSGNYTVTGTGTSTNSGGSSSTITVGFTVNIGG